MNNYSIVYKSITNRKENLWTKIFFSISIDSWVLLKVRKVIYPKKLPKYSPKATFFTKYDHPPIIDQKKKKKNQQTIH